MYYGTQQDANKRAIYDIVCMFTAIIVLFSVRHLIFMTIDLILIN